ncbi:MAG: hypothetical protein EPN61_12795 [Burkholderiaceae bacterium]|nr:MAG: hypothetical protein EPN61_12795 [Burkholderiaceae bacterium]
MRFKDTYVVALALSVVFATASALSQEPDDVEALKLGQPKDVASYVSRAFECSHFLGEPVYDRNRAKEIDVALKKWKCSRLDSDGAHLARKYESDAKVLKVLHATREF